MKEKEEGWIDINKNEILCRTVRLNISDVINVHAWGLWDPIKGRLVSPD